MKKIFISFHHEYNQEHAEVISEIIKKMGYEDISVDDGNKIENENKESDKIIRKKIAKGFLRNVDVTIVIVGKDTINRKHIDSEIRGTIQKNDGNKMGAIVVVNALKGRKRLSFNAVRNNKKTPSLTNKLNDNQLTEKKLEWLPEILRRSFISKHNISKIIENDYENVIFPIVGYEDIKKDNKILSLAIEQAISSMNTNRKRWVITNKAKVKDNVTLGRKMFQQYPG